MKDFDAWMAETGKPRCTVDRFAQPEPGARWARFDAFAAWYTDGHATQLATGGPYPLIDSGSAFFGAEEVWPKLDIAFMAADAGAPGMPATTPRID